VLVASLEGLDLEVLSVVSDVGFQLGEILLDSVFLGDEDVVGQIASDEDV
jgi:hypothetical protein